MVVENSGAKPDPNSRMKPQPAAQKPSRWKDRGLPALKEAEALTNMGMGIAITEGVGVGMHVLGGITGGAADPLFGMVEQVAVKEAEKEVMHILINAERGLNAAARGQGAVGVLHAVGMPAPIIQELEHDR